MKAREETSTLPPSIPPSLPPSLPVFAYFEVNLAQMWRRTTTPIKAKEETSTTCGPL